MGSPDFWIRTVNCARDEDWSLDRMWAEMTTRRPGEKNIGYCESHDQALVGDKTLMFRLADQEMYWHMADSTVNEPIRRAVALHKLIRLTAFSLAGEGYLNFMGNEFGHPEWIDFPREGNHNSFHYCRRQWSLADAPDLQYRFLLAFDRAMLPLADGDLYACVPRLIHLHNDNKLLIYRRGAYLFALSFHPVAAQTVTLPPEELGQRIRAVRPEADADSPPESWLGAVARTDSGRVASVELCGVTLTGTEARRSLGLRSTDFDVSYDGENFVFTVRGYGHGVGMSQQGADLLAENGMDYAEILEHYYPGTELISP